MVVSTCSLIWNLKNYHSEALAAKAHWLSIWPRQSVFSKQSAMVVNILPNLSSIHNYILITPASRSAFSYDSLYLSFYLIFFITNCLSNRFLSCTPPLSLSRFLWLLSLSLSNPIPSHNFQTLSQFNPILPSLSLSISSPPPLSLSLPAFDFLSYKRNILV